MNTEYSDFDFSTIHWKMFHNLARSTIKSVISCQTSVSVSFLKALPYLTKYLFSYSLHKIVIRLESPLFPIPNSTDDVASRIRKSFTADFISAKVHLRSFRVGLICDDEAVRILSVLSMKLIGLSLKRKSIIYVMQSSIYIFLYDCTIFPLIKHGQSRNERGLKVLVENGKESKRKKGQFRDASGSFDHFFVYLVLQRRKPRGRKVVIMHGMK